MKAQLINGLLSVSKGSALRATSFFKYELKLLVGLLDDEFESESTVEKRVQQNSSVIAWVYMQR